MKLLLLVFAFLSAASAQSDFKHFFGKYAAVKMLTECYGEEFMKEWTRNFTGACSYCNQRSPEDFLRDLPLEEFSVQPSQMDDFDINNINEENLPSYLPPVAEPYSQVYGQGGTPTGAFDLPTIASAMQGNLTHPILLIPLPYHVLQRLQGVPQQGAFYRKKREVPMIDADAINKVYQKIRNKAGNFTCIMMRMQLFNEDFDVNVGYQVAQFSRLNLDSELKSDIYESLTDCIRFATCKPLDRRSLMPPAVQRAITFMKCESKMNLAACVKNDLMKKQNKFDIGALENIPAGSDTDLGDKMLAIMWGKFARRN